MNTQLPIDYQIVTENFACLVQVDCRGVIMNTAPLLRKFKQQKMPALIAWLKRAFLYYKIHNLEETKLTLQ